MNKRIPALSVLMVLATISFLSCKKIIDWKDISPKHMGNQLEVIEYHLPYYEDFNIPFPVLFKKVLDPSGKKVKEIDCSFFNVESPFRLTHHELIPERKGKYLYILDKYDLTDTIVTVRFNNHSRPESLTTKGELADFEQNLRFNNFFYENNRLAAVETIFTDMQGNKTSRIDSIPYDSYGNILSFGFNFYQYDYNKKPRQQFYVDDLMQYNNGYYLLQYLNYFPEVTNPTHVRTQVQTPLGRIALSNHSFDEDNRLTGYQFGQFGRAYIKYNY